jgi:hypothetical protein
MASGGSRFGGAVNAETLNALTSYFRQDFVSHRSSRRPVRPPEATAIAIDFLSYYQHAAPFDPRGLLALWERCQPQSGPCLRGQKLARGLQLPPGSAGVGELQVVGGAK